MNLEFVMQNGVSHSQKEDYAGGMYLSDRLLAWCAQGRSWILRTTEPNKEKGKHKKTNTSYEIHRTMKIPRNRKEDGS